MKIKRIQHVAIAVNKLEPMTHLFEDLFGLEVDYTETPPSGQVRLAMLPAGETAVELLEGLKPGNRVSNWIATRGEGLYHICFEVEDIDEALTTLRAKGVKLLNETPAPGHNKSRIAFIDPVSTGGLLIELAEEAKATPSAANANG